MNRTLFCLLVVLLTINGIFAQNTLKGKIKGAADNEPLIGATVLIKGTSEGANTDFDGIFELKTSRQVPFTIVVSYLGYDNVEVEVTSLAKLLDIRMEETAVQIGAVEVTGQRISDKQKESPLTVESMDLLAIKATPADNFYDGLGSMKGVDLTAASLGFKIINMRG
ncbi:MAG TPA: carboxypeptidase-like regulatory domain-containing protein, partial [Saprospiraceae bacterium]|nr:carboxypeptidase-like regulatory domain-containing protein [Saprospiraceae bacterium]